MPTAHHHSKREPLNLRIKPEERALIDRAAEACGKSRTSFVLDAARAAAEETLLDQSVIKLSRVAYAAFLARLDEPPTANVRLRKTMRAPSPWKKA